MSKNEKPIDLSPPFYIVAALKFLEAVYPSMALKLAKYFFFTPISFQRPARENKAFEQATRKELMIGKKKITVYIWGKNTGKKILLVHGWSGRATQFFKLKNFLLARGFQVYSFDGPAHGENKDFKQTHMLEFVEAIERVNMTHGPFYGAIGHSLGGLAILNAYNKGFQVEKIATIAAPCSIENVVADFCRRIKAGEKTKKALIQNLVDTYKVPIETYGGHTQAKSISARGLIVHDMHDHDVSVEEARMLDDAWKGARLLITKNNGHRRILLSKYAVAAVADFFGKRPAQQRSGNSARPKPESKGESKPNQNGKAPQAEVNQNTEEVVKRKPRPKRRPAKKPAQTEAASVNKDKVESSEQPKNEQPRAPRKPQRRRPPRNNQKSENATAKPSNDAAKTDKGE